jgi:hypothetical protein
LIENAAREHGQALATFAARSMLAQASGLSSAEHLALRQLLLGLMQTGGQVRKVGVLLNQAVTVLNATGIAPQELLEHTAAVAHTAHYVDQVAAAVHARLP